MVAVYDKLIAEVIGDQPTVWGFLRDKAEFLTGAGRQAEALRRGKPRGGLSRWGRTIGSTRTSSVLACLQNWADMPKRSRFLTLR